MVHLVITIFIALASLTFCAITIYGFGIDSTFGLMFSLTFCLHSILYFCFLMPIISRAAENQWSQKKFAVISTLPVILLGIFNPLYPAWIFVLGYELEALAGFLGVLAGCCLYSVLFAKFCLVVRNHQKV